jgi:SH3 domain protein
MRTVPIWLHVVLAVFVMTAIGSPAPAETRYISDTIDITLRRGPGTDHTIISMIQTGQTATLLQSGKNWSRIRLADGKTGWVLNRFLSGEKPSRILLAELQGRYDRLETIARNPLQENMALKQENEAQAARLATLEKELEQTRKDLASLARESKTYLQLKTMHQQVTRRLKQQSSELAKAEAELENLRKEQVFRWFLSGAGVLLLGFLMGVSARRNRRRSTLR